MSKNETQSAAGAADNVTKFEVKHAFGCQVPKLDAVLSFSASSGDKEYSDRLVFKVGKQACIFNPETTKQEFFDRSKNVTDVLHFAISSNNRFISMCEMTKNEKTNELSSHVSVYSLSTLNKLKTLTHAVSRPYICSAFCGDPKLLAALTDEPDRHIVVWQWEKEKLYKTVSLNVNVSILRSAPSIGLMLTTTGHGVLKNWCVAADAMIKSNNFLPPAKEASENFLDHVWLPSTAGLHKMVALADAESGHENAANRTRKQNIYIFEGRETPHNSAVGTPSAPAMPIALELKQTIVLKLELGSKIEKIIPGAKVFMLVGSFGLVATYERTDDKHDPYIETRRISLGDKHLIGGTIYPSDERMVLVTKNSRMFNMALDVTIDQIKMSSHNAGGEDNDNSVAEDESRDPSVENAKTEKKGTHGVTDLTAGGYHCATLLAADLAYERPLMITIGADCTARLWNYNTMKCELTHDFGVDEPISVAFHSSGFQVLVSFKDRIKLYNVLLDKLKQSKEAILKNCKCLKFSNGSQYWAAASAINIVVYETKSFQQLVTFQGHMMTVVRLTWAPGDQVLFSAGMDGNVYGWPIAHSGRVDIISASNRSSLILDIEVDSPSTVFQPAPKEADEENGGGDAPQSGTIFVVYCGLDSFPHSPTLVSMK
jgi:WD40 repeat protein